MENKGALELFNPTKAELQTLATKYETYKIEWLDDKKWYDLVHGAEMILKKYRVKIKKTRLEFTRPLDERKKEAMELETELLDIISPIETSLKEQKKEYDDEKDRIKEEKRKEKEFALQSRVDELAKYDYIHHDLFELSQFNEEFFQELLWQQKAIFTDKETIRIEKERIEKAEKEKNNIRGSIVWASCVENLETSIEEIKKWWFDLAEFQQDIDKKKEMFDFDAKQEKFKKDQDKLAADQKKIQDDKDQIENDKIEAERKKDEDARVEKAEKDAAEKATKDAEDAAEQKKKDDEETARKKKAEDDLLEQQKQEKLEKETKYKNFLKKNDWKYDWFFDKDWERILYKIVDKFKI